MKRMQNTLVTLRQDVTILRTYIDNTLLPEIVRHACQSTYTRRWRELQKMIKERKSP